ncbi:MAG: glycyl-radical enzyme activating protein [Clostridia bacterium]|nr:glycyl-radical enzyme activating protein [Clostridia bacterium]
MKTGHIFDIKEFSVNDGPGIRTTVFLRGCPLRCVWCHNPEGLEPGRGVLIRQRGCLQCGRCRIPCNHSDCQGLERCLHACPMGLVEELGRVWDAESLAKRLLRDADLFESSGGGVTLSGGEPLLQHEFVFELLGLLPVHKAVETCGYTSADVFLKMMEMVDLVMLDIKLADPGAHRRYTGVDNTPILENLRRLKASGKPHLIRVPLIPDITDTPENLSAIAALVGDSPVELLPYNRMAGAKYPSVGKQFTHLISKQENNPIDTAMFQNATLRRDAHS